MLRLARVNIVVRTRDAGATTIGQLCGHGRRWKHSPQFESGRDGISPKAFAKARLKALLSRAAQALLYHASHEAAASAQASPELIRERLTVCCYFFLRNRALRACKHAVRRVCLPIAHMTT